MQAKATMNLGPAPAEGISLMKKWLVATRPFSFPASAMPVLFGTAAAVVVGGASLNLPLFLLALLAMMTLHSGANMLSDVNDFRKGLDQVPTPVSGAVVRGYLSEKTVLKGAILFLAAGSLMGLILVKLVGPTILLIGAIGIFVGVYYTVRPFSLKYHALGDFAVLVDFGILGALGAWTVQTGKPSWIPVLWVIPIGMLIMGILHANNWRDMATDGRAEVTTIASKLGDRWSLTYYGLLIFGPYVYITLLVVIGQVAPSYSWGMPPAFLIIFFSLPLAFKLWKKAQKRGEPENPLDFIALDGATAQLNLVFGVLSTLALVLQGLIRILA
jgi:1,4-dihydroxy-2-naphthoate octaprenyltransferase